MIRPLAALIGAVLLSGVALASPAPASPPPAITAQVVTSAGPDIVSDDPVDNTPDVLNGTVNAILQVGDTVYVGGRFTSVRERGSAVQAPKANIFAFSASTGKLDNDFNPVLKGGGVDDIVLAADGQSMYISGWFNKVNGQARTQKIAHIGLGRGDVVKAFRSPVPNGRITDLNRVGDTLYVGGLFNEMKGVRQEYVAALDATSGARLPGLALDFSGTWNGGVTDIRAMDVSPDGRHLVVAGNFTGIDGEPRPQIALVDLPSDGVGSLSSWATTGYTRSCAGFIETYLRDVAFSPDSSYFVAVTTGGTAGVPYLCDTAARWETGAEGAGQQPTWAEYTGGDTFTRVVISDSAVYVGGHFRWLNNPFSPHAGGGLGSGGVPRTGLAALDPMNGSPYSWDPTRDRGYGVYEFTLTEQGLWMGHDTKRVHGEVRSRLAYFPLAGGITLPPGQVADPTSVYVLGLQGADDLQRASLGADALGGREEVAGAGPAWGQASGAFILDDVLYTLWDDGTMTRQPWVVGAPAGVRTNIDLYGLGSEFASITGLFYDPAMHRIYYATNTGTNQLCYRAFNVESQTLGAVGTVSPVPSGDPHWDAVSGMFLAGGRLHYTEGWSGNLKSIEWRDGSTVPGTVSVLGGPGVDGTDWHSAAMVAGS